jgi:hypothetical protein
MIEREFFLLLPWQHYRWLASWNLPDHWQKKKLQGRSLAIKRAHASNADAASTILILDTMAISYDYAHSMIRISLSLCAPARQQMQASLQINGLSDHTRIGQ